MARSRIHVEVTHSPISYLFERFGVPTTDNTMARFYYLLLAFDHPAAAEKCAAFLRHQEFVLESGPTFRCDVGVWASDNQRWFWVQCEPEGVRIKSGVKPWVQDAQQLDEVAARLYQTLTGVKDFTCAIVGWEVADFFLPDAPSGYSDLRVDPAGFLDDGWHGLVIAERVWAEIDENPVFQPFGEGYVWQPYRTLSISGW